MGKIRNLKLAKVENEQGDKKDEPQKITWKDNLIFFAIISVPTVLYIYMHFDQFQDAYSKLKQSNWKQHLKFLILFISCWVLFYVFGELKNRFKNHSTSRKK